MGSAAALEPMVRLRACGAILDTAWKSWQHGQRQISSTQAVLRSPASGKPLYEILLELDELGRGRRVSKTNWADDRFWHIVDVAEHPRSAGAPEHSAPQSQEQQADNGVETDASESPPPPKTPGKLPSVFAIKFADGAPTTGRVMKLKQIFKKEWRLLPQT